MKDSLFNRKQRSILWILPVFVICFLLRFMEYSWLRWRAPILGEALLHKLAGIGILVAVVLILRYRWREVGFTLRSAVPATLLGLMVGAATFFVGYRMELYLLELRQLRPHLQFYVTGFSVEGNYTLDTGLFFVLICILGNIINVVMEEGMFRGLFLRLGEERVPFGVAMLISSALFGVWHCVAHYFSWLAGRMSARTAFYAALTYLAITFVMGLKYCLLVRITGSLWMSMADHFVNNTIVNLLHVTSATGVDELQFVRITIAQTLSSIITLVLFFVTRAYEKPTFRWSIREKTLSESPVTEEGGDVL